jgi:hypothetical protein
MAWRRLSLFIHRTTLIDSVEVFRVPGCLRNR